MIKIDEQFYIDSDSYQYILLEKKINSKTQKEYYSSIAFLSTIEKCIKEVIKIKQRKLCKKDLDLVQALNELHKINCKTEVILNKIGNVEN